MMSKLCLIGILWWTTLPRRI